MRYLLLLGLSVAAAVCVGCGTDADRGQASRAAVSLYRAVGGHDGATACAQMSPALRRQIVSDAQKRCERAVLDLHLSGRTPAAVKVYADAALVRFAGGDTVFLGDTREGWRVEAVGCRPQGKGPYDCEEQA